MKRDLLQERAVVERDFAILTPEGHCESPLPNYENASVKILAAPVMGADFAEYLIDFKQSGKTVKPVEDELEYFLFVLSGGVRLGIQSRWHELGQGDFAYLPPKLAFSINNESKNVASLIMLKRPYIPFEKGSPEFLLENEASIQGSIYMGLEDVILKKLLPDYPAFDIAMNIFTYQPGSSLPQIETHIMQHGVYMLQGQGLCYLGSKWYQVKAGDFIWMGNFVPQSFYCTGSEEARYIYYKDINRDVTF